MRTYRSAPLPLPDGYGASLRPPAGPNPRAAIRSAIREERHSSSDPVRRIAREIVREELAAAEAASSPLGRMKAAVSDAFEFSADRTKRKTIALAAVRGFGVGLRPDDLTALATETAATIGCGFAEAILSLTTEDAR